MILRRFATVAASLAAITFTSVGLTAPAGAVIYKLEDGGKREKLKCEDAGSVPYKVSVDWHKKYRDANLTLRVDVDNLVIRRSDADAGPAADAGVDVRMRVYSINTKIQDLTLDGADLDFGIDDQLTLNPRNPRSRADVTRISVVVGTDGDGLGNCPLLTFYQPPGLPLDSVV